MRTDLSCGEKYTQYHTFIETQENFEGTDEQEMYDKAIDKMIVEVENYNNNGSNWIFNQVYSLDIHTTEYGPIAESSYMLLPKGLH